MNKQDRAKSLKAVVRTAHWVAVACAFLEVLTLFKWQCSWLFLLRWVGLGAIDILVLVLMIAVRGTIREVEFAVYVLIGSAGSGILNSFFPPAGMIQVVQGLLGMLTAIFLGITLFRGLIVRYLDDPKNR